MKYLVDLPKFTVPLGNEAREQAKKFQGYQSDPQQAKQVYLNTLAIYATSFYLEMLDFETDLAGSDSWNPAMQAFMDSADLNLPGLGKLECVPISSETEVTHIPFDALEDRAGYVFVEVNEAGTKAVICGFADKVESEEFSLKGLRAIDELPEYLVHLTEFPQEVDQDERLPEHIRRLIAQMLKDGWRKVADLADNLIPQQELSGATACAASGIAEVDLPFCKTVYLEENKQEIEICTEWTDVSDLETEFDILVLARTYQGDSVLVPQANSDVNIPEIHKKFLPIGLEISVVFPDGEVHDSIKANAQTTQVELTKLSVFGNTQFNIKISNSDFVFIDCCRSPE